jgi:hypothetical protein
MADSVKKIGPIAFNFAGQRMTMFIVAGAALFVMLMLYLLIFRHQNVSSASVPAPPQIDATVGGAGTPMYNAAVVAANEKQAQLPGSTVATPIGIVPPPPKASEPQKAPEPPPPPPPAQPNFDNQAMREEIASILKVMQEQNTAPFQTAVIPVEVPERPTKQAASAPVDKTSAEVAFVRKNLKPGHLLYATFVNRLQSDVPGPAVGEIVEGPLSGYRLMGGWSRPKDSNVLSVTFSGVVTPSGEVVPIKAVAVDPNTTLPGNASSVDHLILERAANFLGATFIAVLNGYSQAQASAGQTVITNGLGGSIVTQPAYTTQQAEAAALNNATKVLAPISDAMMQKVVQPSIVHVAPGTPFGLLVLQNN